MAPDRLRLLEITTGFLLGDPPVWEAFAARLAQLGLREPNTLVVDHLPEAQLDALPQRLAAFDPGLIFSGGSTQTVRALPFVGDLPVVAWGVAELLVGREIGNVCGFAPPDDQQRVSLTLLRELVPNLRTLAALYDADYAPGTLVLAETRAACAEFGLRLVVYDVRTSADLDRAFGAMPADQVDAVRVMNSRFLGRSDAGVAERALAARLPLMSYDWTTKAGGLISYVPDFIRLAPRFADVVAAVAHGRSPRQIGVQPCPTMGLHVNRTTAAMLGLPIPAGMLSRATHLYD